MTHYTINIDTDIMQDLEFCLYTLNHLELLEADVNRLDRGLQAVIQEARGRIERVSNHVHRAAGCY